MNRALVILAVLLAASCSPPGERMDSVPGPMTGQSQSIRGVVRIVGSAPVNVQVVLQPEGGRSVRLTGSLRGELERLAGVDVIVTGKLSPSPDPMVDRELEATGYEIGTVNGRSVIMGEVVEITSTGGRLRTAGGRDIYLTGLPAEFRPGQKVWVQGPESIVVQSYGVLRP